MKAFLGRVCTTCVPPQAAQVDGGGKTPLHSFLATLQRSGRKKGGGGGVRWEERKAEWWSERWKRRRREEREGRGVKEGCEEGALRDMGVTCGAKRSARGAREEEEKDEEEVKCGGRRRSRDGSCTSESTRDAVSTLCRGERRGRKGRKRGRRTGRSRRTSGNRARRVEAVLVTRSGREQHREDQEGWWEGLKKKKRR